MTALSIFGFLCLCFLILLMIKVTFAALILDSLANGRTHFAKFAGAITVGLCVLLYYISPFVLK